MGGQAAGYAAADAVQVSSEFFRHPKSIWSMAVMSRQKPPISGEDTCIHGYMFSSSKCIVWVSLMSSRSKWCQVEISLSVFSHIGVC